MKVEVVSRPIRVEEYQLLRSTTGWDPLSDGVVKKALEKDLFSVVAIHDKQVIGMGRVIGDAGIYFYLQDIIVHPDFQGQGLGAMLMASIEEYLSDYAPPNAFIGLMAAEGVKDFYKKYGYEERPEKGPGMFKRVQKP